MKKKEVAEQRYEFCDIDEARWERIMFRSKTFFSKGFHGLIGETGGDFNVAWRYIPAAKMAMFRVISRPKYLGGDFPLVILRSIVFGFLKDGKREDAI
ncbi:MAG: hypothetical protein P4K83_02170 [Terracidiphilus sp.]|nr:hypothetical protein [Terracidiphilus sp.]